MEISTSSEISIIGDGEKIIGVAGLESGDSLTVPSTLAVTIP